MGQSVAGSTREMRGQIIAKNKGKVFFLSKKIKKTDGTISSRQHKGAERPNKS